MMQTIRLAVLFSVLPIATTVRSDQPDVSVAPATVLVDAVESRQTNAIDTAFAAQPDVNATQPDGMTALHWAVLHDDHRLVQRLLEAGAKADVTNRYGISPLAIACTNGIGNIVKQLLAAGADAEERLTGKETMLMLAARTGRLDAVNALVEAGADVNAKERRKQTAIMWAAAEGHTDVVERLINAGADFRKPLESGFTPLFFAIREGRTATALTLLKHGLNINAAMISDKRTRGPNPLLLAVENGHFETAVALLEAGADANAQPAGHAALHAISWVRRPLRGDGDPPPVGSGKVGSLALIDKLLACGADVNVRLAKGNSGFADLTTTGATPLFLAAGTGDMAMVNRLLDAGADPSICNADDATPLLAAVGVGDLGSGLEAAGSEAEAIAMAKLLLERGADINVIDENGETVMHGAAYQNWPQLIGFLAEHGADVNVWNRKNKWGWTPLMIAQGYREGNFRPDPATTAAVQRCLTNR